jgi:transposase
MLIIGLDVCKLSVVACAISQRPSEPRQFYYRAKFETFEANAHGVKSLLALNPDIAVFEPTGTNYSKLWGTHLARNGIEVRLVGHTNLRHYRKNTLELPDKDDQADALALACYCFDYLDNERKFVQIRNPKTVKIRELTLRLAHLNRCQSPIINRLRQDLAWQFPEIAKQQFNHHDVTATTWLNWLAGTKQSPKYEKLYQSSIGLGLTSMVQLHAQRLVNIHLEEMVIESELEILLEDPCFIPYLAVFARFGFGDRIMGIILSQIYPLEAYLNESGKPLVIYRRGRFTHKVTKRHLSRRRFEKALGIAPTEDSSGDKKGKSIIGGSDLCRIALWQWLFTRIEVKRNRPQNEIGIKLGQYCDREKATGKPIRLVRMRLAAKSARLLFAELVKELS